MTGGWVAVTAGSEGVHWAGGHLAPPGVQAVETLGAGDVFHGAFALALAEGSSEEHALRFASAAAAVRCSRTGGWSALANRTEVELLMEETWSPQRDSSGG
jgi:sulfofructose kinase